MSLQKEYLFLPGTKVSFMVIVFHVTILEIGIDIANIMDRRLIKEMEVSTWTSMSNVTIATIMDTIKDIVEVRWTTMLSAIRAETMDT